MNVAIYVYERSEELDWAGPWEVLAAWADSSEGEVTAYTLADTAEPIRCAHGLRVLADHTWDTAPPPDVILVPGGDVSTVEKDETLRERLRSLSAGGALVTSVCNGAAVLAYAGLLDGKPATTHWAAVDRLRKLGVEMRPDERFVDAGNVVTSAGVSAGIDMALYLVSRLDSLERAREVRRGIQYDPDPPV